MIRPVRCTRTRAMSSSRGDPGVMSYCRATHPSDQPCRPEAQPERGVRTAKVNGSMMELCGQELCRPRALARVLQPPSDGVFSLNYSVPLSSRVLDGGRTAAGLREPLASGAAVTGYTCPVRGCREAPECIGRSRTRSRAARDVAPLLRPAAEGCNSGATGSSCLGCYASKSAP
jgi:hypothetical protein